MEHPEVDPTVHSTKASMTRYRCWSLVELLQATGISNSPLVPRLLVFWIGNAFDPWDLACYALGTLLAVGIDARLRKQKN